MLTVKGSKDGLVVNLDTGMPIEQAKKELREKFESTKEFFNNEKLNITINALNFSEFEICELQGVIKEVLDKAEITFLSYAELKKAEAMNSLGEEMTKFYKGTVRSGQRIEATKNLVVIGDANPGSELVAGGNVIVVGALRGMVHAGAKGDEEAFVLALSLLPTQLRIANFITRAPDDLSENVRIIPEIAKIREGSIIIEQFSTKNT
ncbi:MAG: septum site-determining protein MinC [Clostridia bacterium]|nr:septum site-determining protein MinC [Clostridia bacterium]